MQSRVPQTPSPHLHTMQLLVWVPPFDVQLVALEGSAVWAQTEPAPSKPLPQPKLLLCFLRPASLPPAVPQLPAGTRRVNAAPPRVTSPAPSPGT